MTNKKGKLKEPTVDSVSMTEIETQTSRFCVSIEIPKGLHNEIKQYAKVRKVPISTFTYNVITEYIKQNPLQDPYFEKYKTIKNENL